MQEKIHQPACHSFCTLRIWMGSVGHKIGVVPGKSVRATRSTISPQVGSPSDPGRCTFLVIEIASNRIHSAPSHLVDLRLDRPLYGEPRFVGVGLRIQRNPGVASVNPARNE